MRYSPSQGRVFNASNDTSGERSRRRPRCPAPSTISGDPFNLEANMVKNRQKAWERVCLEAAQKQIKESEEDDVARAVTPECPPPPRPRRPIMGELYGISRGRPFGTSAVGLQSIIFLTKKF